MENGLADQAGRVAAYTVLNVAGQARQEAGSWHNSKEAAAVLEAVRVVRALAGHEPSVGVITFYRGQKQNLSLALQENRLSTGITVNTVDAFQVRKLY